MKRIQKDTKATVIISSIILFSVFLTVCSSTTKSEDQHQAAAEQNRVEGEKSLTRIVFITTSRACDCTMTRCQNAESSLQKAITKYPKVPRPEQIDYASETERARKLISKYTAVMLPIIYFIDEDGNLLDGLEGEFSGEDISELLGRYAGGKH